MLHLLSWTCCTLLSPPCPASHRPACPPLVAWHAVLCCAVLLTLLNTHHDTLMLQLHDKVQPTLGAACKSLHMGVSLHIMIGASSECTAGG